MCAMTLTESDVSSARGWRVEEHLVLWPLLCASCEESKSSLSRWGGRMCSLSECEDCECEAHDSPRADGARPHLGLVCCIPQMPELVLRITRGMQQIQCNVKEQQTALRVLHGSGVHSARGALCVLHVAVQTLTE